MAETNDRRLSEDETRKYLGIGGIGKDSVCKWIDKYGMPAHCMGRLCRFLTNAIRIYDVSARIKII